MKLLASIFSVYFLMLSLAPNMQGVEYVKLAGLIKHYEEHQSDGRSYAGFFDFLTDHYAINKHYEHEHEHMPFKSHIVQGMMLVCSFQVPVTIVLEKQFVSPESKVRIQKSSSHSLKAVDSKWNPPRMA